MPATIVRSPLWFDTRRKPPRGTAQIDFAGLGRGLDALWLFDEGAGPPRPWLARGSLPTPTFRGVARWEARRGGMALYVPDNSDISALVYANPGVTWNAPQSQGAILVEAVAAFDSGDSLEHGVFGAAATSYPGGPGLDIIKWSDNNLYAGWWVSGSDQRVIIAATGLWSAGQRVQIACTWNTTASVTTRLYVNAVERGSRAAALTTGDTASGAASGIRLANSVAPNNLPTELWSWYGDIYYVAVWARELTAAEIFDLYTYPYAFLRPIVRRRWFVSEAPPPPSGLASRRLLVGVGR